MDPDTHCQMYSPPVIIIEEESKYDPLKECILPQLATTTSDTTFLVDLPVPSQFVVSGENFPPLPVMSENQLLYTDPDISVNFPLRGNSRIPDDECSSKAKKLGLKLETEKYHACSICLQAFPSRHLQQKHQLKSHRDCVTPFECFYCLTAFSESTLLFSHYQNMHLDKKFSCLKCTSSFDHRSAQSLHTKSCTGKPMRYKRRKWQCNICLESLAYKSRQGHLNSHIETSYAFECYFCFQGFDTDTDLKLHTANNHGDRVFHCRKCSKTFQHRSGISGHSRTCI